METIANILAFIAGELLCVAGILMAGRLGYAAIGNLTWDRFYSKQWSGLLNHYIINWIFAVLAVVLVIVCIAFAVTIPYILLGAA